MYSTVKKFFSFFTALPIIAGLIYFIFYYPFSFNFEIYLNDQYLLVWTLPIFFMGMTCYLYLSYKEENIGATFRRNLFRSILFITVIIILCLLTFSKFYTFSNEHFFVCSAIFLTVVVFFLLGDINAVYVVVFFATLLFLYQLYLGYLQLWETDEYAYSKSLAVVGSLQNSGIYACYLVVSLPFLYWVCIYFFRKQVIKWTNRFIKPTGSGFSLSHKKQTYLQFVQYLPVVLLVFILLATIYLVIIAQSRTAIIALVVLLLAYVYNFYRGFIKEKIKKLHKAFLSLLVLLVITGIGMAGWYLFYFKKMSAIGRFMRIHVALEHVTENFWLGTGLGRFTWYYPQWQAQYFMQHPEAPKDYILTGDESFVLFNEYLQLLKETGAIGFIVFIVLLIYFFRIKSSQYKSLLLTMKLTVIAILCCAFTTYAFHITGFLLMLGFCFVAGVLIGEMNTEPESNGDVQGEDGIFKKTGSKKKLFYTFFCGRAYKRYSYLLIPGIACLTAMAGYKGIQEQQAIKQWENMRSDYIPGTTMKHFSELYPFLHSNGKYLNSYGTVLLNDSTNNKRAVQLLESGRQYFISRETVENLAKAYEQNEQYDRAIDNYKWLSYYLPGKFKVKQKLMHLYLQVNDTTAAKKVAAKIIALPIKINSGEVQEIINEAYKVIK